MKASTAILFFSRTAGAEAAHKQLFHNEGRNEAALTGLIARTRQIVKQSGLPVFWMAEDQQSGATFGERLLNASRSVTARGYQQLIIVGNDSPQLRKTDIFTAFHALEKGKTVLGRNRRGGTYLIGVRAHQLTEGFQLLPWQTERLLDGLTKFLTGQSADLFQLRCIHDFNGSEAPGLLALLTKGFRVLAACFILPSARYIADIQSLSTFDLTFLFKRRGPPVLG